ncbi:hypothetical protein C8R45DRAFT_490314 [Mycena sanguinolenta]|nr:hypothetical protein C8R45DRAFT_490314 [Mycena sanguinolenta]
MSTSGSTSSANSTHLEWRVPPALPTVDSPAFAQILELDDPEDRAHTYSKDMFELYASQAPATFKDMDRALAATDLSTLADRAHFLMGSSAALGVARVAAVCEEMERVAEAQLAPDDPPLTPDPPSASGESTSSEEQALRQIAALLEVGKREYAQAERWLRGWYVEHAGAVQPAEVEAAPKSAPAPTPTPTAAEAGAPPRPRTDADATPTPARARTAAELQTQTQTQNPPDRIHV